MPRLSCFPLEGLSDDLRQWSETLLLRALDNEALYTLVSELKPMSSFLEFRIPLGETDLGELERTRQALGAWRCGSFFYASVRHFRERHGEKLYAEAAVFNLPALRALIDSHPAFFGAYGLTRSAHPMEVVMAVEYDETVARYRGYGYLYGYPEYAVDYFAQGEITREETRSRVARDILSVPTWERVEGAYAWAVPKGHVRNEADDAILASARLILDEYRERRRRYVGPGKPGVVELLRDWYDDGAGRLSPENARATSSRP